MHSIWMGEFAGTLMLVYIGGGVNAGINLRKSFAASSGWMAVCTGWALAVLCGVLVARAFGSPDAHLNPAITLANAVRSGDFTPLPIFLSAQFLGAICGSALMALHYAPHWKLTEDPAVKLGVFCTGPAVNAPWANMISEALGTLTLIVVATAIGSHAVNAGNMAPWLVASLVWAIGLGLGGTTGYAINPARDLGPRLVHTLLPIPGKGPSNWRYGAVAFTGDVLGAVLAGVLLRFAQI
jgi:glycerol uptake facilitator protein